ncbi:MAG: biopolymer transporter ExbD [Pirellulaceae bacterium]
MLRSKRKNKLLIEPASVATGDIAFNLIVFFLVCASTQPDTGRRQDLPRSEQTNQNKLETKNTELALTRSRAIVMLNGDPVKMEELASRLKKSLAGKTVPEDRIVVIKSANDVPYEHWIRVTTLVQDLGAGITIQREEVRTVMVGN